jgi:hypothetical protein
MCRLDGNLKALKMALIGGMGRNCTKQGWPPCLRAWARPSLTDFEKLEVSIIQLKVLIFSKITSFRPESLAGRVDSQFIDTSAKTIEKGAQRLTLLKTGIED